MDHIIIKKIILFEFELLKCKFLYFVYYFFIKNGELDHQICIELQKVI